MSAMPKRDGDLRALFRTNIPSFHWNSIETGATAGGVPDSEYCSPTGVSGWVEFKQITGWVVPLRPQQIGWLLRRSRARGRVFVAVRQAQGDTLWLALGAAAVALREQGLRQAPTLGCWSGGPARWPWTTVQELLTS
jgi:hypothetical protein